MVSLKNPNPPFEDTKCSISITDFPEDVQLCILSFLTQSEISTFACTSKRFESLCRNDGKVWFTMCDRRWGSKTQIRKWGDGKISYKLLYKTLDEWENLIGFWRRSGADTAGIQSPSLVFFEWRSSFITASRVSPSRNGTYNVIKAPFLWMGLSPEGQVLNFLDPDGRSEIPSDKGTIFECFEKDLIPVNVSFMGITHFIVEEHLSFVYPSSPDQKKSGFGRKSSPVSFRGDDVGVVDDVFETEFGSPESYSDLFMSEMYQFFANRTNPVGERSWRRRRRREKERMGKRKWESQHFVKIVNISPTPSRPLQGLWKVLLNCFLFLLCLFWSLKCSSISILCCICILIGIFLISRKVAPFNCKPLFLNPHYMCPKYYWKFSKVKVFLALLS